MPSIALQAPSGSSEVVASPLPGLLRTPLGLAVLEIQGNLNMPPGKDESEETPIGRVEFPLLLPGCAGDEATAATAQGPWMKKVYVYVGRNQRLPGEVRKLAKPYGIVRRCERRGDGDDRPEELQIVDVVRWKIFCGGRPEFV